MTAVEVPPSCGTTARMGTLAGVSPFVVDWHRMPTTFFTFFFFSLLASVQRLTSLSCVFDEVTTEISSHWRIEGGFTLVSDSFCPFRLEVDEIEPSVEGGCILTRVCWLQSQPEETCPFSDSLKNRERSDLCNSDTSSISRRITVSASLRDHEPIFARSTAAVD
jgi:hypothetical protein